MKKKSLFGILFLQLIIFPLKISAQNFELTIENQTVSGDEINFDIYMLCTSGDIYLFHSDLVITFDNTNFTDPIYTVVQQGEIGSRLDFFYTIDPAIVEFNRAILNIDAPGFSNQTQFDTRVQVISESDPGSTLIAKVKISGITNPSGTANIQWRLGSPGETNYTIITTVPPVSPWTPATDISENGTYINPSDAPLPVELSSFTAKLHGNDKIKLDWKTQTEIDNYGFDVERKSEEEKLWKKIAFVEGHGNSSSPKNYSYIDNNPAGGSRYYYRLKQIDNSGSFAFSDEVEVELIPSQFVLFQNYPNPFNPSTEIKYQIIDNGSVKITVLDLLGREVKTLINEETLPGIYRTTWNGEDNNNLNVSTGVYFYRIDFSGANSHFTQTKKMLLVK